MSTSPLIHPAAPPRAPSRSPRRLTVSALALIAAVALGWLITGQLMLPGVVVEGVPVGGLTVAEGGRRLSAPLHAALERPLLLRAGESASSFVPRDAGLELDLPATVASAYAPGHRGNLSRRLGEWWRAGRTKTRVKAVLRWNEARFRVWIEKLRANHGVKPTNAAWKVLPDETVEVIPSVDGRDVVETALRAELERAVFAPAGRRSVRLPLKTVHPDVTTESALFLGIHQVEARYRTYFDQKDRDRTENVRLAAEAIDQVVLRPGDTFSFNREVGPRVPESGYREAPVVVGGKLVPGVGGGVCQVSSTLYNAVLLADLGLVTRYRHSIPSAYVPPGRDATVAYDFIDFRFRNTRDWPVVVNVEVGPGWIEARLLGRRRPWERVEVTSQVLERYQPRLEEIPDPTLPVGQRQVRSKGVAGYRVKVWKILYQDGREVGRVLVSDDRYQPLRGIVRVGTGQATGQTPPPAAVARPPG